MSFTTRSPFCFVFPCRTWRKNAVGGVHGPWGRVPRPGWRHHQGPGGPVPHDVHTYCRNLRLHFLPRKRQCGLYIITVINLCVSGEVDAYLPIFKIIHSWVCALERSVHTIFNFFKLFHMSLSETFTFIWLYLPNNHVFFPFIYPSLITLITPSSSFRSPGARPVSSARPLTGTSSPWTGNTTSMPHSLRTSEPSVSWGGGRLSRSILIYSFG